MVNREMEIPASLYDLPPQPEGYWDEVRVLACDLFLISNPSLSYRQELCQKRLEKDEVSEETAERFIRTIESIKEVQEGHSNRELQYMREDWRRVLRQDLRVEESLVGADDLCIYLYGKEPSETAVEELGEVLSDFAPSATAMDVFVAALQGKFDERLGLGE